MDYLSLESPPEPAGPRLSRTEALLASVLVHVLLILFVLYVPAKIPESVWRSLRLAPTVDAKHSSWTQALERAQQLAQMAQASPPPDGIPLQFTYVKVPNDVATEKNAAARLLSDKNRKARQEMPTPKEVRQFVRDPHSVGDSADRVAPDPRIKEGKDVPKPAPPAKVAKAGPIGEGSTDRTDGTGAGRTAASAPSEPPAPRPALRLPGPTVPLSPAGLLARAQAQSAPLRPQDRGGRDLEGSGTSGGRDGGPPLLANPDNASEYKYRLNNPGYLNSDNYGSMSFDTKGFPWGDYARTIYVIIRNNWLERIPIAVRDGHMAGYTCQHIVIQRTGTVTDMTTTHRAISPLELAARDALQASNPLPPLPVDFPDPDEGVTFCFYYNLLPDQAE